MTVRQWLAAVAPVTTSSTASVVGYCQQYINDLPENIQSQVRLFADDTAVYLTVTNMQDSQVLRSDLKSLQQWERTWDMEFNPGKCQVIHITR